MDVASSGTTSVQAEATLPQHNWHSSPVSLPPMTAECQGFTLSLLIKNCPLPFCYKSDQAVLPKIVYSHSLTIPINPITNIPQL